MPARDIALITVPYDSGHRAQRMGGGPLRLVEGGAVDALTTRGHRVRHVPIELPDQFWTEIGAARRLQQLVAEAARTAAANSERPIVLSGNCNSAIGTTAGVGPADLGVVWLDAHPDLETPETTASGFFDGQGLAMLTGRCWQQIASTVPGFAPIPDERVLFVGGRSASDAEAQRLRAGKITWLDEQSLNAGTAAPLSRARRVYLHVDLDVHGAEWLRANGYASVGGASPDNVRVFARDVAARAEIAAAAITAFDPACDEDGSALAVALDLLAVLAEI